VERPITFSGLILTNTLFCQIKKGVNITENGLV
jgi:hypothetical protein